MGFPSFVFIFCLSDGANEPVIFFQYKLCFLLSIFPLNTWTFCYSFSARWDSDK